MCHTLPCISELGFHRRSYDFNRSISTVLTQNTNLDVKSKMPLSLRPVTYPSGLVRWDKSALILHFFWAWQFLQACVMEAGQMLTIGTAGLAGAPINYKEYVSFLLTYFLSKDANALIAYKCKISSPS